MFAGPYLDRTAHRRHDPAWFEAALSDPGSRVLAVWNSRSLITEGAAPRAAFLEVSAVARAGPPGEDLILLGHAAEAHWFAYEFPADEQPHAPQGTRFEDLRQVAGLLPSDEAGLLGYARAMLSWRRRHLYCGACGAATLADRGGHVRICSNPACRAQTFPRIDPAIIVLVTDGEHALLGRQATWPVGRYSTIAGFVEPGESLEDAVAREVREETGIEIEAIAYYASQPWPFPSSLMLGFTARALTRTVVRCDQELEDARWFTRAEIAAGHPLLPPLASISYRLIEQWFDAGWDRPLREVRGAAFSTAAR